MNLYLLLVLVGCLYILIFGALALLRREGLSVQFALESLALTAVAAGGSWLVGRPLSSFVFLLLLYLVTMRSRVLVDLANLSATRGRFPLAFRLYHVALTLWPDHSSRLVVLTNRGVAELITGQVETSIATLESVLEPANQPRLGIKYEAACRFNLGRAYEKKGEDARATQLYNEVVDLLPGTIYARAAQAALRRRKERGTQD